MINAARASAVQKTREGLDPITAGKKRIFQGECRKKKWKNDRLSQNHK